MNHVVVVETAKSLDAACRALEESVTSHGFGVLHVHDVGQTLARKGIQIGRDVRVFDICNPGRARDLLEKNVLAATALPCSVSVFSDGPRIRFAFIRPTALVGLLGSPAELLPIAEGVERTVREIVNQAAK